MRIRWPGFDARTVAQIEDYLDLDRLTEIVWRASDSHDPSIWAEVQVTGLSRFVAAGAEKKRYNRPMVEVFDDGATSAVGRHQVHESCPECDDWSRTAVCTVHPELSLDEIRWHRQQDRRWPNIRFGPPREGERWAGDPEHDAMAASTREQPPLTAIHAMMDSLRDQLGNARMANRAFTFGFEVSRPGEWTIDVANPA